MSALRHRKWVPHEIVDLRLGLLQSRPLADPWPVRASYWRSCNDCADLGEVAGWAAGTTDHFADHGERASPPCPAGGADAKLISPSSFEERCALVTSLADVIDLERYPIDRLDSPAGQDLVARCCRELAATGTSDLERFMRPAAVASVVDWAMMAMPDAYRTDTEHNVYFTADDPELPAGDPRRTGVRSAKSGLAYDQIPSGSPLRVAYESDELTAFVAAALGRETLYRHADILGALNVMYYAEGDELGWHFDGADSVVTLMLQAPLAGGRFEYVPMLRSADDENLGGVRRLLQGDRSNLRAISGAAGALTLFRGHLSPHHVTAITGPRPRINAVLSYASTPDARLSDYGKQLFYGRTG